MFSKIHRLSYKKSLVVKKSLNRLYCPQLNIVFVKSLIWKALVIVSKKTIGKAVKRNRIKRIVKAALFNLAKKDKVPAIETMIFVKQDIALMKTTEVEKLLENLLTHVC